MVETQTNGATEPKVRIKKGKWADKNYVRAYNRKWRAKRKKEKNLQRPNQKEITAKRLATLAARKAAKEAENADPGRADAIIYLRHALRWLTEKQVQMDKAHLLGQLALKSLQGE